MAKISKIRISNNKISKIENVQNIYIFKILNFRELNFQISKFQELKIIKNSIFSKF